MQIDNSATREIQRNYGFIPNQKISTHLNAHHVLGNTPMEVNYPTSQTNTSTTNKSIPAAASTILGFGLKFIPVPKKSIYQDDLDEAIKLFDRDFYLKVFFAKDDEISDNKEIIENQ